jgi:hypothetical protein
MSTSFSEWTFAQKAVVIVAGIHILWAIAGFIAEPSFHTGADAPTEKVLGVDFNGWHAAAGLLLFGPAFLFALRPDWALFYAFYAAFALISTGIWALWSNQVAIVFTFPNNEADAVFHIATGVIFLAIGLIQVAIQREQRASAAA